MALRTSVGVSRRPPLRKHVTSIGNSVRSMPKNKHKRKSWKKYRGQGR
jgi:hypothetical protein